MNSTIENKLNENIAVLAPHMLRDYVSELKNLRDEVKKADSNGRVQNTLYEAIDENIKKCERIVNQLADFKGKPTAEFVSKLTTLFAQKQTILNTMRSLLELLNSKKNILNPNKNENHINRRN